MFSYYLPRLDPHIHLKRWAEEALVSMFSENGYKFIWNHLPVKV
jgi:hypothetical protein